MSSRRRRASSPFAIALIAALVAGCSAESSESATNTAVDAPTSDAKSTVVVDALDRPTQIADGPGDTLLIAQLAGDENASTGEVLAVDVEGGTRRVLLSGLDKPTGVAWSGGVLWVMVRRSLLRVDCPGVTGPLAVFAPSSTPTGVAVIGDDVFVSLFVTGQPMRVSMSGWVVGDAPVLPVEVVTGLDGPHTVLARADGTLWTSEHLGDRVVSVQP